MSLGKTQLIKRILTALTLSAVLASCGGNEFPAYSEAKSKQCFAKGYMFGTDEFNECVGLNKQQKVSQTWPNKATEQRKVQLARYGVQCNAEFGFKINTPEHRQCVFELDANAKAAEQQKRPVIVNPVVPAVPQTVIVNPSPVFVGNLTCIGTVCY